MKPYLHYLATPIRTDRIRQLLDRVELNKHAVNVLTAHDIWVYSPMLHYFAISTQFNWPSAWSFWKDKSLYMVERSDFLIVLTLDGWYTSVGVQAEVRHACEKRKPVYLMRDPYKADLQLGDPQYLKDFLAQRLAA